MTLEDFRSTRMEVGNVKEFIVCDRAEPGLIYLGNYYILRQGPDLFYAPWDRGQIVHDLATVEEWLWDRLCSIGPPLAMQDYVHPMMRLAARIAAKEAACAKN